MVTAKWVKKREQAGSCVMPSSLREHD